MKRYPIWSYLNITSMDAPMISVAWHLYFCQNAGLTGFEISNYIILCASVWLGYMADRLFDVRQKKSYELFSSRHKFCKDYESKLWILWLIIFIVTVTFSLNILKSDKFVVCFILMLFIALYNYLNFKFSQKKFPKEICVASLFSYGTLILIEKPFALDEFLHFALICFLNCLILTHKNRCADIKMNMNSWSHRFSHQSISMITVLIGIFFIIVLKNLENPFILSCLACLLIHTLFKDINDENFRFALESAYIFIPIFALI